MKTVGRQCVMWSRTSVRRLCTECAEVTTTSRLSCKKNKRCDSNARYCTQKQKHPTNTKTHAQSNFANLWRLELVFPICSNVAPGSSCEPKTWWGEQCLVWQEISFYSYASGSVPFCSPARFPWFLDPLRVSMPSMSFGVRRRIPINSAGQAGSEAESGRHVSARVIPVCVD